jgi:hypothetical protein
MLVNRTPYRYTDTIGAGIGEASGVGGAYRIIVGCEQDEDELAPERRGVSPMRCLLRTDLNSESRRR